MGADIDEKLQNELQIMDTHVKEGQTLVAAFGAMLLLKNKAITVQSSKGKGLRSQLDSIFSLIVEKSHDVGSSLVDRMASIIPDRRLSAEVS